MHAPITSLYAGLCALIFALLSAAVIRIRRRERIPLLDGGREDLKRAMRAQGNFAEYVPLLLILLFLMENNGFHPLFLHAFGLAILISRTLHAYSVHVHELRAQSYRLRVIAMATTLSLLALGGIGLIGTALR